jgi:hypothetical protein
MSKYIYVFVVSFSYYYARHLSVSPFFLYLFNFGKFLSHLCSVVDFWFTDAGSSPRTPTFQRLFLLWKLRLNVSVLLFLKLSIVFFNDIVAKGFLVKLNGVSEVQLASLGLILLL